MNVPPDLFKRYAEDPLRLDEEVRSRCHIPDDRYYTVSVWPESTAGRVTVDDRRVRSVKTLKISKSNQSYGNT